MKHIYILSFCLLLGATAATLSAQPARTAYFMDKTVERTALNPAFQPERGYFSVPFIGSFGTSLSTNTLTVDHLFYPRQGGGLVTFLDPSVSADAFLGNLSTQNRMHADFHLDVIKGGWFRGEVFWSYGVGIRTSLGMEIPRSMFEFIKTGSGTYDISNLRSEMSSYLELSAGYSRPVNDRWTVGGKLKLLPGLAGAGMHFENLHAELSSDSWRITSRGQLDISARGVTLSETTGSDGHTYNEVEVDNFAGISGLGAAVDLGASFRLSDNLTLSASLLDLGFIGWFKNATQHARSEGEFLFDGFDLPVGDDSAERPVSDQLSSLTDDLEDVFRFSKQQTAGRTSMLSTTLLVGGEYTILNDRLGFGLLSATRFYRTGVFTELTASANYQPLSWFGASLSYSMIHGYNTCGFALNFAPKICNFFLGTDYIPARITPQGIPVHGGGLNVSMGLSVRI